MYLLLILLAWPLAGQATIPLEGYFIAQDNCPAFHSIRKSTNPGNITLTPKMAYEVTGKNKPNATHYLIKIEDEDKPLQRWVSISCGQLLLDCKQVQQTQLPDTSSDSQTPAYLLAVSWQPAFCQTHQQKDECRTQTEERFDAKYLSLHGLWPQPRNNTYCGVSSKNKSIDRNKHWNLLPSLQLSNALFDDLLAVMPGVASYLQRHEWIKHGTCYSDSPETYYQDSLDLMNQLNDSFVRDFIVEHIGEKVTTAAIRQKFDESFGQNAGSKVNVRCEKGMVQELWINLQGNISKDTPLSQLLKKADVAQTDCNGGLIDPVGF